MPLEVVRGESRNRLAAEALAAELRSVVSDGTVYLAYPVLATADERVEVDALLVFSGPRPGRFPAARHGSVGAGEWDRLVSDQDRLYAVIEGHLAAARSAAIWPCAWRSRRTPPRFSRAGTRDARGPGRLLRLLPGYPGLPGRA